MSFDISSIDTADTFKVELIHPRTGQPARAPDETYEEGGEQKSRPGPVLSVTVYGPGSKPYAAARARNNLRIVERLKRKGRQEANPEEDLEATANFLSVCTVSFDNFNYKGMPEGPEAFRALYADPKMGWITEQVNAEMGDWANFTGSSSTGS